MTRLTARWQPPLLVAALTVLVFLPALGNGFVNWDDDENFLWNPHYRGLGWANLRWMFTAVHQGLYVPMAWVTLGLDHVLWGMNPTGYHLASVIYHALNAALLYLVAERLLAAAGHRPRHGGWPVPLGAAAAALFFSLHPLRAESVAWVTERRDVVAGLFTLLTVLAYLKSQPRDTAGETGATLTPAGRGLGGAGGAGQAAPGDAATGHPAGLDAAGRHVVGQNASGRDVGGRMQRGWYWAAVAAFALALLSKSIVVGLPLVLLAMDVYPLRRLAGAEPRWRRLAQVAVEKLPFLALSAGISALTLGILAARGLLVGQGTLDLAQRLALSAYGLAFYLGKTLVPWPLSPIYTLFHPVVPLSPRYLLPAGIVLLITAVTVLAVRRWPAGIATWAAYVLLLLPVLGVFHSGPQITADRYSYFSGLPLALLAGGGAAWCLRAAAAGRIAPALGPAVLAGIALALVGLGAMTARQVGVWRDSVTLWRHAAMAEPESDIPVFYLGWALEQAGRRDEARIHFTRTLDRVPATLPALRAQVLLHRGIVAQRAGDARAAADDFRSALAVDPEHAVARIRLATALAAQGEREAATAAFANAAELARVWPRYQLWEIRAAVREVPADQPAARAALGRALGALLERHGVRDGPAARP